jgi:hypothetical protein
MLDHDLRSGMQTLAPAHVDDQGVWETVQRRTMRVKRRRVALVAASSLVLIVAAVLGVSRLYEVAKPQHLVIVTSRKIAGTGPSNIQVDAGQLVDLFQVPAESSFLDMQLQLRGHLLAWLESYGHGTVTKALDLQTGHVWEVPGSRRGPNTGNVSPPTWVNVLPDGKGGSTVLGGYGYNGAWAWQPGAALIRNVVRSDIATAGGPLVSGDVGILRTSGVTLDSPFGDHPLLVTGRDQAAVPLDPAKPQVAADVLAGLSPYWAMPAMPGSPAPPASEVSVWDLRTGEKKLLDPGPINLNSPVRIAGNLAAWVTGPPSPSSSPSAIMPHDVHFADISTGTTRVVATVTGDDLTQHFLASLALNDQWLVWLEPRGANSKLNAAGQRVNGASDGFDLVGFHLPDLTPLRVPWVVKVGEGVSEVPSVLELGDNAAVLVVSAMPPQPKRTTVRMVDLTSQTSTQTAATAVGTATTDASQLPVINRAQMPRNLAVKIKAGLLNLGRSGVPLYLPTAVPPGYTLAKGRPASMMSPLPTDMNPGYWGTAGTNPGLHAGGYSVVYTDGQKVLAFSVNPAGDLGDVTWQDLPQKTKDGATLQVTRNAQDVFVAPRPQPGGLGFLVQAPAANEQDAIALAASVATITEDAQFWVDAVAAEVKMQGVNVEKAWINAEGLGQIHQGKPNPSDLLGVRFLVDAPDHNSQIDSQMKLTRALTLAKVAGLNAGGEVYASVEYGSGEQPAMPLWGQISDSYLHNPDVVKQDWFSAPTMSLEEVQRWLAVNVGQAANGVVVQNLGVELLQGAYGVRVELAVPKGSTTDAVQPFMQALVASIANLNSKGAKIPVYHVFVRDADGNVMLVAYQDQQIGMASGWTSPEFRGEYQPY